MKYFKKLVGERIYLSPVNVEDAEKYVEWFCDFKMTDGIGKSSSLMTVEKVGFKEYGRRREAYFLNGKYYDHVYMDILAREFEGSYIKNKNV